MERVYRDKIGLESSSYVPPLRIEPTKSSHCVECTTYAQSSRESGRQLAPIEVNHVHQREGTQRCVACMAS